MAVSDTKKVQTMINIAGEEIQTIRDAVTEMERVRTRFQAVNPDVTGTPLEGNVATLGNALNALRAEVDKPVWDGLLAAVVPSHRNRALEE